MKIFNIDEIFKTTMIDNDKNYLRMHKHFEEKANNFNTALLLEYSVDNLLKKAIKLPFNDPDKIKQVVGKSVQINDFEDAITSVDFLQEELLGAFNEYKYIRELIERDKLAVFEITISEKLNDFIDNLDENGNLYFIKEEYGYLPLPFVGVGDAIYSFDDIFEEINAGVDLSIDIPEVLENTEGELVVKYTNITSYDLRSLKLSTEYFINNGLKEYYNDAKAKELEKKKDEIEAEINEYL